MGNFTVFETINPLVYIFSVSVATGLLFALMIQPRLQQTNYLFAAFCAALALWSLAALIGALPGLQLSLSREFLLYLRTTAVGLTALSFFVFTVYFTDAEDRLTRPFIIGAPLATLVALYLVWTGRAYDQVNAQGAPASLTPIGYAMVLVVVAYLSAVFWIIVTSRTERARALAGPAILLVLAYASNGIERLLATPVDTLLATAAAVWIGRTVLRFQLLNPFQELNDQLRIATRDLQQVASQFASEKKKTDSLTNELQSSSQNKSEYLDHMSHGLRTPLNSIVGYSELLQSGIYGELNEKQLDRVEKIHRNGKNLLEVINTILDLSKIEAGRLELDPEVLQLNALATGAGEAMREACQAKGLVLAMNLESDLFPLLGDANRIRQIFMSLLDNAVKFTETGNVTLEARNVSIKQGTSSTFKLPFTGWLRDGNWVIASVSDTGIGIAPEEQAAIFEEFYQGKTSAADETEGMGVGLAISKKLVEMHRGVIWLKSAPSQGSTFFVALPAHRESETLIPGYDPSVGQKV